jgi:periplasmic copper chaperone A
MKTANRSLIAFGVLTTLAAAASAHVSLQQPIAEIGSAYQAVLRIGHGCDGAATTAVAVRLPPGFEAARPLPKPGWNVSVQEGTATWTVATNASALPDGQRGEFTLAGSLPPTPGPMWFKVLQSCGQASIDWSQTPAEGSSAAGLKSPAALLQLLSARDYAQALAVPKVEGAWVRSSVPGQQGTGAFMKITAAQPMQLVGVSTPVAGTAEVHEMKMDGDVMRMRAVSKLDLPAGQAVELKPGGYHVMLMDLKQPLVPGSTVPLTLALRDGKGALSKLELKVPVGAAPSGGHKH